ncbi:MAG: preprotein translocase subunit YajC [Planctomycetales bacterium]
MLIGTVDFVGLFRLVEFALLAQKPDGGAPSWLTMMPFVLLIFVFWILILRPQRKEQQTRDTMLETLKKNDRVLTEGGIIGVITAIKKDDKNPNFTEVTIRTHDDTRIDVLRSMIKGKVAKRGETKEDAAL